MKGNLATTIALHATAAGGQTEGSDLINLPNSKTDSPQVRDIARARLVKTNPDVDAAKYNETPQKDNAGFIGKRKVVQDTRYGHLISEHDNSDSAETAMFARPYTRVLHHPEIKQTQKSRNAARKKAAKVNPDMPYPQSR